MLRKNTVFILLCFGLCSFCFARVADAQSKIKTPDFQQTVDVLSFYQKDFGRKGVNFERDKHPLDTLAQSVDKVIPLPLAQLRHINFVIQLELRLRRYKETSSKQRNALEETATFYKKLLEHSHRVSNRFVRVCAHHMGLTFNELSQVEITAAGPLPRDMKEYQQWATQSDPAPCFRDKLFGLADAERVTRLHQLKRLSRQSTWHTRPMSERQNILKEIEFLKHELDGTPWIPTMKMTEINVVEPKQLWLKTGTPLPQVRTPKKLPQVKAVRPLQGE